MGVSTGVKGLRIGTGPRGNYIHMGRGGLYYRKTLPAGTMPDTRHGSDGLKQDVGDPGHEVLREIESGDLSSMFDSSSEELVEELNRKRRRWRLWPGCLVVGTGLTLFVHSQALEPATVFAIGSATVLLSIVASIHDRLKKTAVLLYDIEADYEAVYQQLHDSFEEMRKCRKKWHMVASGRVTDKKRHAGADNIVKREEINLSYESPPYLKTNVKTPCIPAGKQKLYFFPDRVLVFELNGVGGVGYGYLDLAVTSQRFIEDERVPKDSDVVGHTWRYVNRDGGPDRRFNNNKQLPIALYERMAFKSDTGLNEEIQLSKVGVASGFAYAISSAADSI